MQALGNRSQKVWDERKRSLRSDARVEVWLTQELGGYGVPRQQCLYATMKPGKDDECPNVYRYGSHTKPNITTLCEECCIFISQKYDFTTVSSCQYKFIQNINELITMLLSNNEFT